MFFSSFFIAEVKFIIKATIYHELDKKNQLIKRIFYSLSSNLTSKYTADTYLQKTLGNNLSILNLIK